MTKAQLNQKLHAVFVCDELISFVGLKGGSPPKLEAAQEPDLIDIWRKVLDLGIGMDY